MYSEDLKEIFGPRQWRSRTEEIMQLQAERDAARQLQEGEKTDSSAAGDQTSVTEEPQLPPAETPAELPADDSQATPPPFKG